MALGNAFTFEMGDTFTDLQKGQWQGVLVPLSQTTNHLEIYKSCFEHLRVNALIEYPQYLKAFRTRKTRLDDGNYGFKLRIDFDEDKLTEYVIDRKTTYLHAYLKYLNGGVDTGMTEDYDSVQEIDDALQQRADQVRATLANRLGLAAVPEVPDVNIFRFRESMQTLASWIAGDTTADLTILNFTRTGDAEVELRARLLKNLLDLSRLNAEALNSSEHANASFEPNLITAIQSDPKALYAVQQIPDTYLQTVGEKRFGIVRFFLENFDVLQDPRAQTLLKLVLAHKSFRTDDPRVVMKPAMNRWIENMKNETRLNLLLFGKNLSPSDFIKDLQQQVTDSLITKTDEFLENLILQIKPDFLVDWGLHLEFGPNFSVHIPEFAQFNSKNSWPTNLMSTEIRPVFTKTHDTLTLSWANPIYDKPRKTAKNNGKRKKKVLRNEQVGIDNDTLEFFYIAPREEPQMFWFGANLYRFNLETAEAENWDGTNWNTLRKGAINKALGNHPHPWFGKAFSFRRNWAIIYYLNLPKRLIGPNLMSIKSGGGFSGIGRADRVDEESYLWSHEGQFPASWDYAQDHLQRDNLGKLLGLFIGLNMANYLNPHRAAMWRSTQINSITYRYLQHEGDLYVRTNLPFVPFETQTRTRVGGEAVLEVLRAFRFVYFRKVDDDFFVEKVDRKNRPRDQNPEPPIDFGWVGNYDLIHRIPTTGYKLLMPKKFKGKALEKPKTDIRQGANKVMKEHLGLSGTGSASVYANDFFTRFSGAVSIWNQLKRRPLGPLPTDQEWCHLHGNAFGGPSKGENFVSGSKHCNTEQLAMETAQSHVIKKGEPAKFTLKSTAYLFKLTDPSESQFVSPDSFKRKRQVTYEEQVYELFRHRRKQTFRAGNFQPSLPNDLPVAAALRYKILQKDGYGFSSPFKIFDYTFEAQSELFDRNQFLIIQHMVEHVMMGPQYFENWFQEKANAYYLEDDPNL